LSINGTGKFNVLIPREASFGINHRYREEPSKTES
jgi:hypothetical protein